ncbi:unnamed protein product [Lota lota]
MGSALFWTTSGGTKSNLCSEPNRTDRWSQAGDRSSTVSSDVTEFQWQTAKQWSLESGNSRDLQYNQNQPGMGPAVRALAQEQRLPLGSLSTEGAPGEPGGL